MFVAHQARRCSCIVWLLRVPADNVITLAPQEPGILHISPWWTGDREPWLAPACPHLAKEGATQALGNETTQSGLARPSILSRHASAEGQGHLLSDAVPGLRLPVALPFCFPLVSVQSAPFWGVLILGFAVRLGLVQTVHAPRNLLVSLRSSLTSLPFLLPSLSYLTIVLAHLLCRCRIDRFVQCCRGIAVRFNLPLL